MDISSLLQDKSCPTGKDKNKSTSKAGVDGVNVTAKTVSVKENFPLKGKSDNDNVVMQQGLDAKENQGCTCRHEINRMLERIKSLEEQRKIEQRGDRWLPDKGFIVQHILDDYGVRIDTPVKLEGKKQFTKEKDVHNRKMCITGQSTC